MASTEQTRAEVARRRLAQLAESFDAEFDTNSGETGEPLRRETELKSKSDSISRLAVGSDAAQADLRASAPPVRPWSVLQHRHVQLLGVVMIGAVLAVAWWVQNNQPRAVDSADLAPVVQLAESSGHDPAKPNLAASDTPSELVIDVVGEVARPGIVVVPAGARVHEAITAAGGVVGEPETTSLNMARVLTDGEQINVGGEQLIVPPGMSASSSAGTGVINLNSADQVTLETLPGVGPVTAQAIIAWRSENGPFRTIDDLLDVKGIGEATLATLRDHVAV